MQITSVKYLLLISDGFAAVLVIKFFR